MESFYEAFRLNMRHYREKEGVSQVQLALLCGCANGTIGGIEAGRTKPSFDLILRIASSLKVHPADLFLRGASSSREELKAHLKSVLSNDLNRIIDENFAG